MKKKRLLCFDLDDTLIDDNYKFEITFCNCIQTIIQALETSSPQIDDILNKARQIDNEKWKKWKKEDKYLPKRTALTWVETYEHFAQKIELKVRDHIKRLIWSQVMQTYDPPFYVIPGAIETLIELQDRGYNMNLISIGLPTIQKRKVRRTKLDKYFSDIHIVRSNKYDVLSKIAKKCGKENITMIGNSMRRDINPALSQGIEAIYIPRGNWHRFHAKPVNNKFKELKSIEDILNILK